MSRSPLASNQHAVAAALAIGVAVAISSFSAVRAERVKPNNSVVYSCVGGTACIEGEALDADEAVLGISSTGNGVVGQTSANNATSAVAGISTGTFGSAHGVYGRSATGQGVYGTSSGDTGVEGWSTSFQHSGVAGYQKNTLVNPGNGVYGESADTSSEFAAVWAQADSSGNPCPGNPGYTCPTFIFVGQNVATGSECTMDGNANLWCSGSNFVKTVRTRHVNDHGQRVLAYAAESASASIDDVGSARMAGGVANVAIDPAFASTIDRSTPYHVFLTPMGDTRGLYVSDKTSSGFQVREAQGGRSTLSFDYRIVARPIDAEHDRLPLAPPARKVRRMP